jgi:sulfate adenylyltransferase large subunit
MPASTDDLVQLRIEDSRSGVVSRDRGTVAGTEKGSFDIEAYLAEERTKDLLRFSTAGSVDDGKSTLIGRLLYDTQNVYDDQIRSIERRGSAGEGVLDLALLTDGLRAEREQGITIDVAYRYFSTAKRKFIIADTPGHEQYTRNMATGASTADVAIVLVDARRGVLTQSRRHAYITSLLGVPHIIVAVNKMDLVDYSQAVFENIREEFSAFHASTAVADTLLSRNGHTRHPYFVPVSALKGDNVVHRSDAMPWYEGPSLLDLLENMPATELAATAPFRLPVQRVIRPHQDHRSFAGQIASGAIRPGDAVMVLPSRHTTRVRSIVTFDGELEEAQAPISISLTLEDEVDVSRGDLLVSPDFEAAVTRRFTASLVWMDARPLDMGRRFLLKHTSRIVHSHVRTLHYTVDVATLAHEPGASLSMNGIAVVEIETSQSIVVDPYSENRITGSFVLIDPETNATIAAGMILHVSARFLPDVTDVSLSPARHFLGAVTAEERTARWGHSGAHIALTGSTNFADQVERALFLAGAFLIRLSPDDPNEPAQITGLVRAGALVITLQLSGENAALASVREKHIALSLSQRQDPSAATDAVLDLLRQAGVLQARKKMESP